MSSSEIKPKLYFFISVALRPNVKLGTKIEKIFEKIDHKLKTLREKQRLKGTKQEQI
jgi:hypothetical protein